MDGWTSSRETAQGQGEQYGLCFGACLCLYFELLFQYGNSGRVVEAMSKESDKSYRNVKAILRHIPSQWQLWDPQLPTTFSQEKFVLDFRPRSKDAGHKFYRPPAIYLSAFHEFQKKKKRSLYVDHRHLKTLSCTCISQRQI